MSRWYIYCCACFIHGAFWRNLKRWNLCLFKRRRATWGRWIGRRVAWRRRTMRQRSWCPWKDILINYSSTNCNRLGLWSQLRESWSPILCWTTTFHFLWIIRVLLKSWVFSYENSRKVTAFLFFSRLLGGTLKTSSATSFFNSSGTEATLQNKNRKIFKINKNYCVIVPSESPSAHFITVDGPRLLSIITGRQNFNKAK